VNFQDECKPPSGSDEGPVIDVITDDGSNVRVEGYFCDGGKQAVALRVTALDPGCIVCGGIITSILHDIENNN